MLSYFKHESWTSTNRFSDIAFGSLTGKNINPIGDLVFET